MKIIHIDFSKHGLLSGLKEIAGKDIKLINTVSASKSKTKEAV